MTTAADRIAIGFSLAALIFLICGALGPVKREDLRVSQPALVDRSEPSLSGTGFALNAVYTTTAPPSIEGALNLYGSWLGTDTSLGAVHTAWYQVVPQFHVFVAGFPNRPGNQLLVEVATKTARVVRIPLSQDRDPAESWFLNSVPLLRQVPNATRFRIVAVDGSAAWGGWLGFSQPFLVPHPDNPYLCKQLLLVALATAACLLVFISPGLLLRQELLRLNRRPLAFIWIPAPGLIGLAVLGLVAWLGPRHFGPRPISQLGLALLVLFAAYRFIRVPLSTYTTPIERRVLLIAAVLAVIAVAKATYSVGPAGELFQNTISRTLEVGDRSDSRLSYHAVQLIALRSRPFSELGKFLYSSYGVFNFSHRGALPALAASPLVLASPVRVPPVMPDQPWTIFDPEGFSAYRIAMIAIACASLLTVFGIARLFLSEEWALLAFLVTVTAPFVVHEIYFTWPKLESASFVLLAAYLVLRSRYFLGGLTLGVGYLCHPLALLSVPALAGLVVLSDKRQASAIHRMYRWCLDSVLILAGLAVWILLWRHANGRHFAQGEFLSFFSQANGPAISVGHWLSERFESLCNTLVPLYLFIFHRKDPSINLVRGLSPAPIQFCFQYWTGVPFGSGIAYFCCLISLIYIAFLKARSWLILVFAIPLLFFTVYWGGASSGMLREGLHPWFLGLMIFSVVVWKKFSAQSRRLWKICNWALAFRGLEISAMLLLPAVWSQHELVRSRFALSDIVALIVMLAGTLWLCFYMFKCAEDLRKRAERKNHFLPMTRNWRPKKRHASGIFR